jgi:hypothetical protein
VKNLNIFDIFALHPCIVLNFPLQLVRVRDCEIVTFEGCDVLVLVGLAVGR